MAQTIKLPNFKITNLLESGVLDDEHAAGVTELTVANSIDFNASVYIYVGEFGSETGEIVVSNGPVDDNHIELDGALKFDHPRFTPIRQLFGAELKLYRAANTDGLAPPLANFAAIASFDIDADSLTTSYEDTAGGSDYWYRFTYLNSTSATETNLSDSTAVRGGNIGNYVSLDAIREAAGFTGASYISDDLIEPHRKAAQDRINGALSGLYTIPFTEPINAHISDITKRLAAGSLLIEQYATRPEIGQARIDGAEKDLERIIDKEVVIAGILGNDTSTPNAGGVSIWPNGDTATSVSTSGGSERFFRTSDVQGYNSRRY